MAEDTTQAAQTDTDAAPGAVLGQSGAPPAADAAASPQEGAGATQQGDTPEGDAQAGSEPITYEPFQMPEGVNLDQGLTDKVTPILSELGIPQEGAQKLASAVAEHLAERGAEDVKAHAKVVDDWKQTVLKDSEIGGADFADKVAIAEKALDRFGTDALKEVLVQTGMCNHPEVIRALYRVGKQISEDTVDTGGSAGAGATDLASKLYPNQGKSAA